LLGLFINGAEELCNCL